MLNTQYFNNYNSMIIFFRDCEDYIILTSHIDFQINEKKIR